MDDLHSLAGRKTIQLTTVGRKSGQKRSVDIWFVVEGDAILVQAGERGQRGWYVNVLHDPHVELALGSVRFAGTAEHLGEDQADRVAALFRRKYPLARVARWFGSQIGRGKPVRIRPLGRG